LFKKSLKNGGSMSGLKFFSKIALSILFSLEAVYAAPLITAKEAALPPATKVVTRGISRGPSIKFVTPTAGSTVSSPFDLRIIFEPRGDSKVDVNSVKVTYLKFPYVDLTPRLKTAITASGINFQNAEVPGGEHVVKISVQDTEGRETNSEFNLIVAK
jgi:hypothetical protein